MKLARIVLLATLAGALAHRDASAKLQVVSTLEDFASLTHTIGGDEVEAFSLAKGYQDPHFVDAKPSFVLKLSKADLLIAAGLELEIGYLPPLIDQSRNARIRPGAAGYLDASAGCEILGRPTQQVTRAMGDVHPYGNPHYWTDPDNGRVIARAIAAKLGQLDPTHKAKYDQGLQAFESKLTAKDAEWRGKLAPFAGSKIVTFHDSWPNFAKHFRLVVAGHVEPKPGIPPSPSHTLEIANLVLAEKIKVILVEPYFDLKTPKYIAEKTGSSVVLGYPSVGGTKDIPDYFALFDADVNALVAALGGKP
jgi:zinc/manganese transport system substrate-binding protein